MFVYFLIFFWTFLRKPNPHTNCYSNFQNRNKNEQKQKFKLCGRKTNFSNALEFLEQVKCYTLFIMSCDLTRSSNQRVMWLYGWKPFIVSQHYDKYGDHKHHRSGNINIPASIVILPSIRDIRYCILTSAIIIFSKSHCMSCTSNSSLRKNFYGNIL